MKIAVKTFRDRNEEIFTESIQTIERFFTLIYSLDDSRIIVTHGGFMKAVNKYRENKEDTNNWTDVIIKAGALQKALREKLISLRE